MSPRAELLERLQGKRTEIERTALARVCAVEDPEEVGDPDYTAGLRAAVGAAVRYGIEALAKQPGEVPIPQELLSQARMAAWAGVSLDTVLRRYVAGNALLEDALIGEARTLGDTDPDQLRRLTRAQAMLLDRLLAAVGDAYTQATAERRRSTAESRAEQVKRLLAGELTDAAELSYELEGWHVGAHATGPGASEELRDLAVRTDTRILAVNPGGGRVWAWLGSRRRAEVAETLSEREAPAGVSLAIGEPARGLEGWRITHKQAQAALVLAPHSPGRTARYADVALLSAALRDDVLLGSLRDIYLEPLRGEGNGEALIDTLRAYLETGRNASSAAATLGVSRQTTNRRLRAAEEAIGRPLEGCAAELQIALALATFEVF